MLQQFMQLGCVLALDKGAEHLVAVGSCQERATLQLCNNQNIHKMAAKHTACVLCWFVRKHECMTANFAQPDRQQFRLVEVQGYTSAG